MTNKAFGFSAYQWILIFFNCLVLICFCNCNYPPKKMMEITATPTLRVFENKRIDPDVYWYFNLEEGSHNVYEINTGKEKILFESSKDIFEIKDGALLQAKGIIISNDGRAFIPVRGHASVTKKQDGKFKADMNLSAVFTNDLSQTDTAKLLKATTFDYHVKFSGEILRKEK